MKVKIKNLEKGQSLVVVTILLMVFFGMLALVLDGGYSYFMRRNAQNAADAGALAAADIWCETENWDLAYNEGKYYAEDLNGADDEESIITSPGERKVRVETNITFDTFFGRFLGWDQITAVASATAGCYPPGVTEGVLPVAWSCKEPVIVEPYPPPPLGQPTPTPRPWDSADCELFYGDSEYPYQGQMYIIMDANKLYDDLDAYASCQDPPANSETCTEDGAPNPCYPRDPDLLDCDIDNDGINDVLAGGERSWLDLDEDSSSAIELKEWVLGVEDPQIFVNVWLRGAEGGKTVVYQAAETLEDSNVIIPVYNHYCDMKLDPNSPTFLENTVCYNEFSALEGRDDPKLGETTSGVYFHVSTFAVFHVVCVSDSPSKTCPVKTEAIDAGLADHNTFSIEGYFVSGFVPESGGGPNNLPWVGAYTVYLIE